MGFAALHCHSYYSLLDGTLAPEQVAEAAHAAGMAAAALVDRDTLAGVVRFYKKAAALGLHAVVGAEVTLPDRSTLALLVENARGYRNLCRLITAGANDETLGEYSGGLICLAGPRSGVGRAVLKNESPEPFLRKLQGWYGHNLAWRWRSGRTTTTTCGWRGWWRNCRGSGGLRWRRRRTRTTWRLPTGCATTSCKACGLSRC